MEGDDIFGMVANPEGIEDSSECEWLLERRKQRGSFGESSGSGSQFRTMMELVKLVLLIRYYRVEIWLDPNPNQVITSMVAEKYL